MKSIKFKIGALATLLFVSLGIVVFPSQLQAQNVLKKGKLILTSPKVDTKFAGNELVVPVLNEDEGLIVFQVADNARKYFKEDDVRNWLVSKQFSIEQIQYNINDVRVKNNQIRIRYEFQFFVGEEYSDKSIKIDSREFTYNNTVAVYKQKVVFYTIDIAEPPQYDREIFGSLQLLIQNGEDAAVELTTPEGKILNSSIRAGGAKFAELTEGEYKISIKKNGYQPISRTVRIVPGVTPILVNLTLNKLTVALTINSNVSGYDLLIVNKAGQSINQLNKSSKYTIDLEPDLYTIKFTKQGYEPQTKEVDLTYVSNSKSIQIDFMSSQTKIVEEKSSSNTIWYVLLATVAGGAAYYFTSGSNSGGGGGGGYGSPPALPIPFNR